MLIIGLAKKVNTRNTAKLQPSLSGERCEIAYTKEIPPRTITAYLYIFENFSLFISLKSWNVEGLWKGIFWRVTNELHFNILASYKASNLSIGLELKIFKKINQCFLAKFRLDKLSELVTRYPACTRCFKRILVMQSG